VSAYNQQRSGRAMTSINGESAHTRRNTHRSNFVLTPRKLNHRERLAVNIRHRVLHDALYRKKSAREKEAESS